MLITMKVITALGEDRHYTAFLTTEWAMVLLMAALAVVITKAMVAAMATDGVKTIKAIKPQMMRKAN